MKKILGASITLVLTALLSTFAFAQGEQTRGFPNTSSEARTNSEAVTIQTMLEDRTGLDVVSHGFVELIASDTVDSYASAVITAAAHSARRGDVIRFTSGSSSGLEFTVYRVATNTITLAQTPTSTISASDAFSIYRYKKPVLDVDGRIAVAPLPLGANIVTGCSTQVIDTTTTPIIAAQGAGIRIYITDIGCVNPDDTATVLAFKNNTTIVWYGGASSSTLAGVGVYGRQFGTPLRLTANVAFQFAPLTTAAAVTCCAEGFTSTN